MDKKPNIDMEDLEPKPIKKQAAPKPQPKQYTVKVEALVPATLVFHVAALDEEAAIKETYKKAPNQIQQKIQKRKNIKATVYDRGTINVKLVKNIK